MILWKKNISAALALTLAASPCVWADSGTEQKEKTTSNMESTFKTISKAPMVEEYLLQGRLTEGEVALRERLVKQPNDDQARFGLGVLQFLRSIETLGQNFYRFGLRTYSGGGFVLPFLRLPAPVNPHPEQISYEQLRAIMAQLLANLIECEFTLSQIKDGDVKLPLHFGMIQLDLSGTAHDTTSAGTDKSLWKVYAALTHQTNIPLETAKDFYIKFDRGDVHWLRGYCHVLSSVCCIYLAYDSKDLFERTGHLFFTNVKTPFEFLSKGKHVKKLGDVEIVDLIALVHLVRCQLVDAPKMHEALKHLEAVISESRVSWKWIMSEQDDDHEWLPNPRQTGVIPGAHVTEGMVVAWAEIMKESERILNGDLLIPFWRSDDQKDETVNQTHGTGVNLRRFFLDPPRTFDLILWVQGSDAAPYLEKGKLTKGSTWRELRSEFGSHFPGFAFWFN